MLTNSAAALMLLDDLLAAFGPAMTQFIPTHLKNIYILLVNIAKTHPHQLIRLHAANAAATLENNIAELMSNQASNGIPAILKIVK